MSTLLYSHKSSRAAAPIHTAPLALEPVPNWARLSRGDEVAIHRGVERVASGRIDMTALDGSVFWIIQNDGMGRTMFCHDDGLTVFRKADGGVRRPGFYRA
jgi:hypothetical protein